jgi:hypothetical protein
MNMRPDASEDPLIAAVQRLDGAMTRIEGVTARLRARADSAEMAAMEARDADADRARLAEALDESRDREACLQVAAQEASDALDRAIDDLRLVVDEEE